MNQELATIEIPEELLPVAQQSGIQKADFYAAKFAPYMMQVKELSAKVSSINHEEPTAIDAKLARDVRLALVKNRTATSKEKDDNKSALLAEGNLIQGLHNVVVSASQLIEADLTAVEKYAENKEKERIEAVRLTRVEQLAPFVADANIFPLGTMTDDAFTELLTGSRLAHEARLKAEKDAEEKRIAEENDRLEEQKRIREENERLKAEQSAAELALKKEREEAKEKLAAERAEQAAKLAAIEESNRIAREKAAKEQAERDVKAAAELKAAKDEADRLAKIEADRKAAAELAERERVAAEKKAAKAPDKDKLKSSLQLLPELNFGQLKTAEGEAISNVIKEKYNSFKSWANAQIESL